MKALWMLLLVSSLCIAQDETLLLRFPATDGQQIVFSYAGDLYTAGIDGGQARKLTNNDGYEMFPRFSNDGKWLAFTGQYDGNTEVYVMPSTGGEPRRLTYTATLGRDDVSDRMGPNNLVMGWKNKSSEIIFRSRMKSFNSFIGQLFTVGLDGEMQKELPLPKGGFCSFSPDDKKMAYNQIFREFRTWKRYRGGMADEIWIYDFDSKKTEKITDNDASDLFPMWSGNRIYFISDREDTKKMNLYVYDLGTKETKKLTSFTDFDIEFPSIGKNFIVFENGGSIYRFNTQNEQLTKLVIKVADDLAGGRGGLVNVSRSITNYEIAPDGKRALFGARGEVFTVPVKNGITRNLTNSSGVHERNSKWSPDGKWIAYIGDASGENEIYMIAQDGIGKQTQLTRNADTYYYQMYWSPDSKKLLWADKKLRLRYIDVDSKAVTEVDQAEYWEFTNYAWSPDSKWIVYSRNEDDQMNRVMLYSLDQKKSYPVTDGWYTSGDANFSSDGKYIVFGSNRDFNPIYSWTEWNHAYEDMARVFLVTLAKDTESPFKLKNDEVEIKKEADKSEKKESKDKKDGDKKEVEVKVDIDGLVDRIIGLPIPSGNYYNIACVDGKVYYNRKSSGDDKPVLLVYDLKDQKETEIGQINGYEISADTKKMLVNSGGNYYIIDLPKSKADLKEKIDVSAMEMTLDRRAEWKQIFNESWRQMRDFLYLPSMHGVDWLGMRKKYEPLVAHVNHRNDLTYVIGEMIGEINIGHAYVGGGERPAVQRMNMGLLGAELDRDAASKYYRIRRIIKGENWRNEVRSPLTEVGVDVAEGDYIVAVNGKPTNTVSNFYQLMMNTAGKQIILSVNSKPSSDGAREVSVKPVDDVSELYYYDWVRSNIEKVAKATNGQVGYIHVPDMGVHGLNEFIKYFYPQLRKKGLIVDVRGNGGGNVSPMLIERLRREIMMVDMARNVKPVPDPYATFMGPMVCLLNEHSASDGDLFPYRFRKMKLGKLIGKRSWGGVVGIRGSLPLVDGGFLMKPEFASYDTEGKNWIIEGHGVDPDIVVDNDPAREYAGIDDQLLKAVEVVEQEMKNKPVELPKPPVDPKK